MATNTTMTAGVPGTTRPRPKTVPEGVAAENAGAHHVERPGVTPGQQDAITEATAPEPERREPSEVITEIAPEVFPSETEPERREPSEVITEIAPEIAEPKHDDPSEVIIEIAPEIAEPKPYEPSEVITEIAPEISPSEVAPEIRPEESYYR